MSKTNNEIIGELTRKIVQNRVLIASHNDPIKERIKEWEKQISRLLLEDGTQLVDMTLLGGEGLHG